MKNDTKIKKRAKKWPVYNRGDVILDDRDKQAVQQVIDSKLLFRYDHRAYHATHTGTFETLLAEYFNVNYALAVSSGTAAIVLSLMALDLPKGSFIGCPTFTFSATPSAIIQAFHRVTLIEVDENLHLDLADLEKKIKDLAALVVVHMRGAAAPIGEILEITKKYNIPVIEDAVPALGLQHSSRYLGTFGRAGAFSMQSDKSLNTGEGGFILTNCKALHARAVAMSGAYEDLADRHFSSGKSEIDSLDYPTFNFRLDEIRSALALTQLDKLARRVAILQKNYHKVTQRLAGYSEISLRKCSQNACLGDSLMFTVANDPDKTRHFAHRLMSFNIEAKAFGDTAARNVRVFWNWKYLYRNSDQDSIKALYPQSARFISRFIDIPLSPTLDDDDIDYLLCCIDVVYREIIGESHLE